MPDDVPFVLEDCHKTCTGKDYLCLGCSGLFDLLFIFLFFFIHPIVFIMLGQLICVSKVWSSVPNKRRTCAAVQISLQVSLTHFLWGYSFIYHYFDCFRLTPHCMQILY